MQSIVRALGLESRPGPKPRKVEFEKGKRPDAIKANSAKNENRITTTGEIKLKVQDGIINALNKDFESNDDLKNEIKENILKSYKKESNIYKLGFQKLDYTFRLGKELQKLESYKELKEYQFYDYTPQIITDLKSYDRTPRLIKELKIKFPDNKVFNAM